MYRLTISNTSWFECRMYLEHNYYTLNRDYRYSIVGSTVSIDFMSSDAYELFKSRWASKLL